MSPRGNAYRGIVWKILSAGAIGAAIALWFLRDSGPLRGTPSMDLIATLVALLLGAASIYSLLLARRVEATDQERRLRDFARQVGKVLKGTPKGYFPGSGNSISVDFRDAADPAAKPDKPLGEYFENLPDHRKRLVVLGKAGAGKTVAVIQLMDHLLKTRGAGAPVPVLVSLTKWNTDRPFQKWLAEELADRRLVPSRAVARELLEDGLVLPILDGLDEMDPPGTPERKSRAREALSRIEKGYDDAVGKFPLIVVCRSDRYRTLPRTARLTHATVVTLQRLDSARQLAFLRDAGLQDETDQWLPEWRAVAEALTWDDDSGGPRGLAHVLDTPWRMALLTTVYAARDDRTGPVPSPDALLSMPEHQVPDHLLGLYTRAATASQATRPPGVRLWRSREGDAVQVETWLATLARYLGDNSGRRIGDHVVSGTDLVLHRLWLFDKKSFTNDAVLWMLAPLVSIAVASRYGTRISDSTYAAVGVLLTAQFGYFLSGGAYGVMPRRLEWRRLLRPPHHINFLFGCVGVVVGVPLWTYVFGYERLELGLAAAVSYLLLVAVFFASRPVAEHPQSAVTGPRDPLRAEFRLGVMTMVAASLALGALLSQSFQSWSGYGYGVGIIGFPAFVFATRGCRRYLAFRIHMNGLPWRLGPFLDWCCDAGLMRVEGLAYQFRHRELQDWLKDHPQRASACPPPEPAGQTAS
ncbi:NACHT domain-containing protein [Streptomyces smyrnaeus]|uniref:NACHT domain-containing protein n=1 Tax=Streptomyces smyrnaeus TaxID=1387713 RepID=UPI003684A830